MLLGQVAMFSKKVEPLSFVVYAGCNLSSKDYLHHTCVCMRFQHLDLGGAAAKWHAIVKTSRRHQGVGHSKD